MINDTNMIFDKDSLRWYLTEDYVYNQLGIDLNIEAQDETDTNTATLPTRTIKLACDILFDYLESNCVHTMSTMYLLATNVFCHDALKRALGYQLRDMLVDGEKVSERAVKCIYGTSAMTTIINRIPKEW